MKDFFSNLFLAYRAEHIKLKGTAFYIMSAAFGAAVPILYFIVMAFVEEARGGQQPGNYYLKAFLEVLTPYAGFFFPLLIIIGVSRITQFDHKNGGWQLMETQPLQKTSIFFSKYLVLLTVCVMSILVLIATSFLFSWILSFIKEIPASASTSFDALTLFKLFTRLLVASMFLSAFQYTVSVIIPSFIWSILIGFAGMLTYLFLMINNMTPDWYPFEIISRVPRFNQGSEMGYWFTYTETLSVLFAIVILYLGFQWYSHKKLKLAFLKSKQTLLSTLAVVLVFGSVIAYLLIPNTMDFHNRTTLAGKIEADGKINTVYVKGLVDTLAVIPIKDNEFKASIPGSMPFGKYKLLFDAAFQIDVFMGERDSTFLDIKYYVNQPVTKVTGTRLAENQSVENPYDFISQVPWWIENNVYMNHPQRVADQLHEEWTDEMRKKSKFKTVDNYVSKEDFIDKSKKLTTIQLLGYWDAYQKKRAMMYDSIDSKIPEEIQEMKASVNLRDETMLIETDYLKYVRDQLVINNTEEVDLQTKYLHELSKLEKGTFKDNLLYWVLAKGIFDAQNEQEISMLASYVYQFENPKYAKIIRNSAEIRSGLSRGKIAPYFEGSTPGNKIITLKDLQGKLTVIDVWATWCQPCWMQAPYFEKFALKYKNEPIQFVSLSTDQKKDAWLMETKNLKNLPIQLHVNDRDSFSRDYDVQSIPRFILIDAAGKILNASLPGPSESGFEVIIRKELGLSDE